MYQLLTATLLVSVLCSGMLFSMQISKPSKETNNSIVKTGKYSSSTNIYINDFSQYKLSLSEQVFVVWYAGVTTSKEAYDEDLFNTYLCLNPKKLKVDKKLNKAQQQVWQFLDSANQKKIVQMINNKKNNIKLKNGNYQSPKRAENGKYYWRTK